MLKHCIDLSIITTTWNRHKELIHCIEQVKRQKTTITYEHIVVSDGLDEEVSVICKFYNIRHKCIEKDQDQGESRGHLAKDTGMAMAHGSYICLWDDDNYYYEDAIQNSFNSAHGFDIGICNIKFKKLDTTDPVIYRQIPINWQGKFILGEIDTMNVCVRRELATKYKWHWTKKYEGDYVWLTELCRFNPRINYVNVDLGLKL